MFGGMEEMQKQMQEGLTAIIVEAEAGGGLIKIKANAARQILDVTIDPSIIDADDKEGLEDLMLEAMNRVIAAAAMEEQKASKEMLGKMLPPGMENMLGL